MRILDNFNIALDNPVTILHQEQAKTFFSQKDTEKNLWDFVMQSTQLKSIQDEYRDSKTQLELATSQLQEKRRHLEDAKQELNELSRKEQSFEKFKFKNKGKNYNEMIKWGWANDCKEKFETCKKKREEKVHEIEKLENDLEGWKASLEEMSVQKEEYEFNNNQIKDKAKVKEDQIEDLKTKLKHLVEKRMQVESRLKEVNMKQGEEDNK